MHPDQHSVNTDPKHCLQASGCLPIITKCYSMALKCCLTPNNIINDHREWIWEKKSKTPVWERTAPWQWGCALVLNHCWGLERVFPLSPSPQHTSALWLPALPDLPPARCTASLTNIRRMNNILLLLFRREPRYVYGTVSYINLWDACQKIREKLCLKGR